MLVLFFVMFAIVVARTLATVNADRMDSVARSHLRAARSAPAGWTQWASEHRTMARSVAARAAALSGRSGRHAAFAVLMGRAVASAERGAR